MITEAEARVRAKTYLDALKAKWFSSDEYVVTELVERPWGWMVLWNSKAFVETGDFLYALGGNVPFFITRADGKAHEPVTGSAFDTPEHLRIFEEQLGRQRK